MLSLSALIAFNEETALSRWRILTMGFTSLMRPYPANALLLQVPWQHARCQPNLHLSEELRNSTISHFCTFLRRANPSMFLTPILRIDQKWRRTTSG